VPLLIILVLVASGFALYGCSSPTKQQVEDGTLVPYTAAHTGLAETAVFPSYVTSNVRDAYEFALAHPEVLSYMPCYCGCGLSVGHDSNLGCYIEGVVGSQTVRFTDHARYCDICLEIARDAERLLGQGKSLSEIRDYVDFMHGSKGPGTDTERPS
jgi:hypothetical protein